MRDTMDPEKQPLLKSLKSDLRYRKFRPLTSQEVLEYRHNDSWRRARFFLVVMFWSLIATSISILTAILLMAPKCVDTGLEVEPTVAPAHLSLVPLIYNSGMASNVEQVI